MESPSRLNFPGANKTDLYIKCECDHKKVPSLRGKQCPTYLQSVYIIIAIECSSYRKLCDCATGGCSNELQSYKTQQLLVSHRITGDTRVSRKPSHVQDSWPRYAGHTVWIFIILINYNNILGAILLKCRSYITIGVESIQIGQYRINRPVTWLVNQLGQKRFNIPIVSTKSALY